MKHENDHAQARTQRNELRWLRVVDFVDADSPTVLGSCSICWEKPVEAVFLECGHAASCMECAMPLGENSPTDD